MRNLKFMVRTLLRSPFVTAIAIISLALGIGANSAIFSLFSELLLRPLPVPHAGELVNLSSPGVPPSFQNCTAAGDCDAVFSYPMLKDLERANTGFAGIAGHVFTNANVGYRGQTLSGKVMFVTGSYFPVLGIRPALGRLLAPDDDQHVGTSLSAVLSYDYWQTRLGADPTVLDSPILVNGHTLTIVGVAPRGFEGTTLGSPPTVYVPLTTASAVGWGGVDQYDERRYAWIYLFARLKPGAAIATTEQSANAVFQRVLRDAEGPAQKEMSATTLAQFEARKLVLEDGRAGQSVLHAKSRTPLILLLATTFIVLLIACANIANLLLARGASRAGEMAVRLSLGATRAQLVWQLLGESLLLATLGGLASLFVTQWTLSAFNALMPASALPLQLKLDGTVLWATAGISAATGLCFGILPAMHGTRAELATTIREGAGRHSGARAASRFRTGLVTAQIALSMTLLIVAGLFVKSLANVSKVDLGIRTDNLTAFAVSPELNGYTWQRTHLLFDRLQEDLAAVPGVTGVTTSIVQLLASQNRGTGVTVEGFPKGPDTDAGSRYDRVGPGFFSVMGVPILSGREFRFDDALGAQQVAIVNEAFAKKFGLGASAVGKFMGHHGGPTNILIVGLARDAKYSEVKGAVPPVFFLAQRQDSTEGSAYFYVRSPGDPAALARTVRRVVASLDPNLPVEDLKTLPQQVKESVYLDRMIGVLSAAFAGLATLLAAIGLFGALSYTIAQRRREIGVRMALGANPRAVVGMVLRHVGLMTLIGGAIGLAGALALGRSARSLLFEVTSYDPLVIAGSVVGLTLVAFAGALVPAVTASKIDPLVALRQD